MRDLHELDRYRVDVRKSMGWNGDGTCGAFQLPSCIDGQWLMVQASSEMGWDHVSVSRKSRCPNWPEMEYVRHSFFKDDETVMQLHVPKSEHINVHPHCLHLFRPQNIEIPPSSKLDGLNAMAIEDYMAISIAEWSDLKRELARLSAVVRQLRIENDILRRRLMLISLKRGD